MIQLKSDEFSQFRKYLREIAGIDLGEDKQYLVATRLRRILEEEKLTDIASLLVEIKKTYNRQLRQKVIDAMTTNETFWFRDVYPFEYLANHLLPELAKKNGSTRSRIWCAACSSGQEPYSISIMIDEFVRANFGVSSFPAEIIATDLSSQILDSAKNGTYDRLSIVRGLSEQRLKEFFNLVGDNSWQVKPSILERVQFKPLNLKDSYLLLGKFDVVFCRNVLIYFSAELKRDILSRIRGSLKPGGYLVLGSSESIGAASEHFEMIHCNPGVIYRAI